MNDRLAHKWGQRGSRLRAALRVRALPGAQVGDFDLEFVAPIVLVHTPAPFRSRRHPSHSTV